MALATTMITRPEELVDAIADLLEDSIIPVEFVSRHEEHLIPRYPCIQVQSAGTNRDLHGTHTFLIGLRAHIYIMHGDLNHTKRGRSKEDLEIATQVVNLLDDNMTLNGSVIQGFMDSEIPYMLPPRATKGPAIVSTRISWTGVVEARFK